MMESDSKSNKIHDIHTPVDINEEQLLATPSKSEIEKHYDGKKPGDWKTVYCGKSWAFIVIESIYVSFLLIGAFALCFQTWNLNFNNTLLLTDSKYATLSPFIYCFSAGIIGGTLFAIKWLYHCVARQKWHIDRILWRIFTPWISGVFALVMYVLMKSGLFSAFDGDAISNGYTAFSIGFLVGYFSDSAMSKFREIADTLFGKSSS